MPQGCETQNISKHLHKGLMNQSLITCRLWFSPDISDENAAMLQAK